MPLPLAHSLVGISLVSAFGPLPPTLKHPKPLLIGAFLANLPDFDFLLVLLFGVPEYHRGFTHSLFLTAALFAVAVAARIIWRVAFAPVYAAAFGSHCVLDFLLTKGGGGVELWWPFSSQRIELGLVSVSEFHWQSVPLAELIGSMLLNSVNEFLVFSPLLLSAVVFRHVMMRRSLTRNPSV